MENKFWEKVYECEHEFGEYYDSGGCDGAEGCYWIEQRCVKCGVYSIDCGCGYSVTLSGEPFKKTLRRERKAYYNKKNTGGILSV